MPFASTRSAILKVSQDQSPDILPLAYVRTNRDTTLSLSPALVPNTDEEQLVQRRSLKIFWLHIPHNRL